MIGLEKRCFSVCRLKEFYRSAPCRLTCPVRRGLAKKVFSELPLIFLTLLLPYSSLLATTATFTDITVSAGVDYLHYSGGPPIEAAIMTGGAAAGDFDGDGWTDLFITRLGATDILFRNLGNDPNGNHQGFSDVSAARGFTQILNTNGAAWGDIDNDGDLDLYLTAIESLRFYLYINDGSGNFTEQALLRGAAIETATSHSGFSVTFGDYDRDGYLDIHTDEWDYFCNHSRLLRNRGATAPGNFTDETDAAGVGDVRYTFASRFCDLDGDGWADLAIASDFGYSRLFWNNGDGTFTNGTGAAQVGTDENGMGSALGDVDGDGRLDWFVTSIYDPDETCAAANCGWSYSGNRLYRNEPNRLFSDQTDAAGVRNGHWGWGAVFLDCDNDRDLDLVMTNGFILTFTPTDDPFNDDPMRFWENDGLGQFTEISAAVGVTDTRSGKGLLTFDYDKDGDLDIFVVNNFEHPVLYRNDGGNGNDWLRIKAIGTHSNRDGLGAFVTVMPDTDQPGEIMVREINAGSHYLGQSEFIAHFGLGPAAEPVDLVTVRWPSGLVQKLHGVLPNQLLIVEEPDCGNCLNLSDLPADVNRDGRVDLVDFVMVGLDWMACTTNCP